MNTNEVRQLNEEVLDLFHGLMDRSIGYKYDKLCCAMKTDICEVFNDVAEEFVLAVMGGQEVTTDQLQRLHDNLVAFGEEFEVEEATALAGKVKATMGN